MITIKLFWMLFSWLYWLPASGAAWNSKGHKHYNGNRSVRHGDAGDAVASPMLKNWPLVGQKFSKFG